jgi:hypothetical protein
METLIQNAPEAVVRTAPRAEILLTESTRSLWQRYETFIKRIEFYHFGIITMAILTGSCLGSISAMFVFYNGAPIWVFAIGLFASLANLVACISQAPTKWVVIFFALSVAVNVSLIALFPMM